MIDPSIPIPPMVTSATTTRARHITILYPERPSSSALEARPAKGETPMRSHVRPRLSLMLGARLAVLTAFTLCALAVPPPAEAQKKKVLNIAAKEPDTLDPHTSTLGQAQAITRFMYRGLTRFAIKDGKVTTAEVEPDLAESWTLSPGRHGVDVQAQEGRAVPQGLRRDDGRGREVQLRAADQARRRARASA